MGNIGDTVTQTIPAVGTSGTTYATNINLFLTEVKTRLETLIPRTSLAAGDFDLAGHGLLNAEYLDISNQAGAPAAPSATSPTNALIAYGGNLYWQNSAGAVKITSGTTLNTSLVGGITGDYGGANPAQFRFVDVDQEYYAYDDYGTGAWARVWARNFDLAAGATGAVRARLAFGGVASATYTFPTAPPVTSDTIMQMSATGQMSVNNTVSAGITAASYNFTNTVDLNIPSLMAKEIGGSTHAQIGDRFTTGTSTNPIYFPLSLRTGDRIVSFCVNLTKNTTNATAIYGRLYKTNLTGTATQITAPFPASASDIASQGNANGNQQVTATLTTPETVLGSYQYYIGVIPSTSTGGDIIFTVYVTYNRP